MNKALADIECFPNFFMLGVKDYITKEVINFIISETQDDRVGLYNFLKNFKGYWITFNGVAYDDIVLTYFVKEFKYLSTLDVIPFLQDIKRFSSLVIDSDDFNEELKKYKWTWKYNKKGEEPDLVQVDLYRYWAKSLRMSKQLSLKALAIQLDWDEIQELPYYHKKRLSNSEQLEIIRYNNRNDLGVLDKLVDKMKDQINLRRSLVKEYDINCMSWDAPKIASKIIQNDLELKGVKTYNGSNPIQSYSGYVNLKDILIPLSFNGSYIPPVLTKEQVKKGVSRYRKNYKNPLSFYQNLLNDKVKDTDEICASVIFENPNGFNLTADYGSGGIHGVTSNKVWLESEWDIVDWDFSGFYPNLIKNYKFVPRHLGNKFLDLFVNIINERMIAKKNKDEFKSAVYKLLVNSTYGMLGNEYSYLKDIQQVLAICINGQLIVSYLMEKAIEKGYSVIACNTDGFSVVRKKGEKTIKEIIKEIEDINTFDIELEYFPIKNWWIRDINNYICQFQNGKIKKKGLFNYSKDLGESVDALIIPMALEKYFIEGIQPKDFIPTVKEPYPFCLSKKINKGYKVYWNGVQVQNLNRFFIKKNSPYLYKSNDGKKMENILKGFGVSILNKRDDKSNIELGIDFNWYVSKTLKEIDTIEKKTLFDGEIIIEENDDNKPIT